ncbi:MAG: HlyC/CorC family transporter [Proteobacteria bacterium]|nr:HlyC/CorC family transporter [Pseudomonadota bacterium]
MTATPELVLEILVLLVFTALNGLFAVAEMTLISSGRTQSDKLSGEQSSGALAGLRLSQRPMDLLSTLQVGMTLLTLAAGLHTGANLAPRLRTVLQNANLNESISLVLSYFIVFLLIAGFVGIFGNLLPKRLARLAPAAHSLHGSRPVLMFAFLFEPFEKLLSKLTNGLCTLFVSGEAGERIQASNFEIKSFLQESAKTGAFDATEQRMVQGVIEFSEARISSFMTRRPEVVWLDIDDPAEKNRRKIIDARHSHFPVVKGSPDNVVGVIHVKDILSRQLLGQPFDLTLYLEQALYLPESADASRSVELFRNSATHFAFVVDEYGNVQGVLTLTDILRAIVGDFADTMDDKSTTILKRQDGSWIVDGLVTVQELRERLMLPKLRGEDSGNFHTVAGFILSELGKIPKTGDAFDCDDVRYEVIDMDGNRVDKVLIQFRRKEEI